MTKVIGVRIGVVVLIGAGLVAPVRALRQQPSLADVAKKAAEERAKQTTPAKVITITDTGGNPASGSGTGTAGASSIASAAPLVLDSWDYSFKPGRNGNNFYTVTLRMRNVGTKAIKLIDAGLEFTDLLGEQLYGAKIPPDVYIAVGATEVKVGDYPINQFINREVRMIDMKKADVRATLAVRRLVFTDDSVFSR